MATISGATGPVGKDHRLLREDRRFVLTNLSIGHAFTHCFTQSYIVVLPYIQNHMGFGDLQYGLLLTFRQLTSGVVNIPLGFFIDMVRQRWGLIFAACLLGVGMSYLIAGSAPNYWVLLLASAFVAFPGSVWHLPAFAVLSQRFPEKKGFALATHSAGGNFGGAFGPLVAGALIWALVSDNGGEWRYVLFIYAAPAFLMIFPMWWSLRTVGQGGGLDSSKSLGTRIRDAVTLMKRPTILALTLVLFLRALGFNALNNWSPKYLADADAGNQSAFFVGFDMALYIGLGIIFAPILGMVSDKIGRKKVIIPGLIITTFLTLMVVLAGSNVLALALIFAAMGPFSHTLSQLLQAGVLDIVGRGTEATAMGLIQGFQSLILAGSPLLVGLLSNTFGIGSLYYYSAAIFALAIVVLMIVPIETKTDVLSVDGQATTLPR